jgi:hypothetical protein
MRRWTGGNAGTGALSIAVLVAFAGLTQACGGDDRPPPLRQLSNSYSYVITADDVPPHARQDIHYTIQIFDSKTRQPIENGEGQIFAGKPIDEDVPTGPQSKTWDGMTYGPEIGTYHAKMNFVVAGTWAVAIRFRRDSLRPLERVDWMQQVLDEKTSTKP